MNNVNKTLYIPLYGKALVSQKGVILQDKKAEEIWEKEGFPLKGKSKSKWLAYFMAMRAKVYDTWILEKIKENPSSIVLHIGCGLDSRISRVSAKNTPWYDIDFPSVIDERRKYFPETAHYHLLSADMRKDDWQAEIPGQQPALIVMEGVSMYFAPEELTRLLSALRQHFSSLQLLMDCYSLRAAKLSKYKNPINDVGVTAVYGYEDPFSLAQLSGLAFEQEYCITPNDLILSLPGTEQKIFRHLFAGKFARSLYRMYAFKTP